MSGRWRCREPEFSGVVGLLHRGRVRDAPRARVQRDSEFVGADRHFAAIQISDYRTRCDEIRESGDFAATSRRSRSTRLFTAAGAIPMGK